MSYIREIRVEGDLVSSETLKFFDARTNEEIDDVIAFTIRSYADGRYTMVDIERPVGEKCPSARFWETWKLVGCAKAAPEKPCKFDFSEFCHTCKGEREVVYFNVKRPCPDCPR